MKQIICDTCGETVESERKHTYRTSGEHTKFTVEEVQTIIPIDRIAKLESENATSIKVNLGLVDDLLKLKDEIESLKHENQSLRSELEKPTA
jgi:hypothetical protein